MSEINSKGNETKAHTHTQIIMINEILVALSLALAEAFTVTCLIC